MGLSDMEYLVIGAGLSGGVIARQLAEAGHKVEIWDRRHHIGGNMYDYIDEHGILVHKYGPHTFHTNKKVLYDYMCRFGEWIPYQLTCGAVIKHQFTPTPFNFKTIDQFYSENDAALLKNAINNCFQHRLTATVVEVLNADDERIRNYGQFLFDYDYSLYTAKQWGISPAEVDPSILKRVPLRLSYDEGYFDDTYQVMPKVSYVAFFDKLLKHPNIVVRYGIDALDYLSVDSSGTRLLYNGEAYDKTVIYTGALDELFQLDKGQLPYRSLRFEWHYDNMDSLQPYPVTAYPAELYTRITEYKKLPVQQVQGTSYAVEYSLPYKPGTKQEPYYPVLTEESQMQAELYKKRADLIDNFYYCGRLADFKYYNMDQAFERALQVAEKILEEN